jgi:hypothetical protein
MEKNWKIVVNIFILLLVVGFVWYIATTINKEETSYVEVNDIGSSHSDYKKIAQFELPHKINRFEINDSLLYISASNRIYIYNILGELQSTFGVNTNLRDIEVDTDSIYVLYPDNIEVYTTEGILLRSWNACSQLSDYCSFALAENFVFVTDASNKNICKYTRTGNFVKFISSPNGFIIPSYSFDIKYYNDTIYCVNSGRHKIEKYSLNGDFIASFGGSGGRDGYFAGCCNPSYISFTDKGDILTSEKGNPRISNFHRNGNFEKIVLNSFLLGGGKDAYEIRTSNNKLFVAGANTISIFESVNIN